MENKIKIFESEEFGRIRTLVKDGEPCTEKEMCEDLSINLER